MGEKGVVIEVIDDKVVVQMTRTEACAKCRACTVGFTSEEMLITAKNYCGAKQNDKVNVELESADFLTAILISYGLPFCALILGFAIGYMGGGLISGIPQEITGFLMGVVLMLLSFLWIRAKEEYWRSKNFVPSATEICND